MQFHTFPLDEESQDHCLMMTPFGKCECLQLPMGFLNSPSWAQAAMDEIFLGMTDVKVHIDEVGIFSNDHNSHVSTVQEALKRLEQHNFSIEASECHWCKLEGPWLGHIATSTGILPNPEKIKPMLNLEFPKAVTEMQSFIGMVNFCRSFQKAWADVMALLRALSGRTKGELDSTPALVKAFKTIKQLISEQALLAFPDPNIPCDIHTDALDLPLGATIEQKGNTIAFFLQRLSAGCTVETPCC